VRENVVKSKSEIAAEIVVISIKNKCCSYPVFGNYSFIRKYVKRYFCTTQSLLSIYDLALLLF
jgi:hypothetical protein